MKKSSALFNHKDIIAYLLVAGTGAAVQFGAGHFLRPHFNQRTTLGLAYIASFLVGFALTKLFAFDARNSAKTQREIVKFGMVAVLSYFITVEGGVLITSVINALYGQYMYQVSIGFYKTAINVNEAVSLLIAMGLSFLNNYVLHKTFTFRSTGFYDRAKAMLKL